MHLEGPPLLIRFAHTQRAAACQPDTGLVAPHDVLAGPIDSSTSWAASKIRPRQTGADGAISITDGAASFLVTQGATFVGYSAL